MYIEKEFLLKKIDDYCKLKNIKLSFEEKYKFSTLVSHELDKSRLLDADDYLELLQHNINLETYEDIMFNDEILSIECIGEQELIDIDVTGNKLFIANGILTHNSAVNNTDASNDAVSDSIGTVQTADFIIFLLQNEQMKEENIISCKCTKNRFTGITDNWEMNIDYQKMRFSDLLVQGTTTMNGGMSTTEIDQTIDNIHKEDIRIMKEKGMSEEDEFDYLSACGLDK